MGTATHIHYSIRNIVEKVDTTVDHEPSQVRGFTYVVDDLVTYPSGFRVDASRSEWYVSSGGIYSFESIFEFVELADMLFPEEEAGLCSP